MLVASLLLTSCGYHLVGQGESSVIPEDVTSARLTTNAGEQGKLLLAELQQLWLQHETLPPLESNSMTEKTVVLRIEQASQTFSPIAFDAAGLALQYQLSVSGLLNIYQQDGLLWSSGMVSVRGQVFGEAGSNNPSTVEAERVTLAEQLEQQWAQDVMARLQSGF